MCTIVLLRGVVPDRPLVIAANRDEYLDRAWDPPAILGDRPRVLAGRDQLKGGTWLGTNDRGLFVAVTNHRTHRHAEAGLRSRGEVVSEALRCNTVDEVGEFVSKLDGREYNPFNLVWGDARAAHVAYARRDHAALATHAVPEGVHVLPNDVLDAPTMWKVGFVKRAMASAAQAPWADARAALATVLTSHDKPALDDIEPPPVGSIFTREILRELQAVCVHLPTYGTRSAAIVALADGRVDSYAFAHGAPCVSAFVEIEPP